MWYPAYRWHDPYLGSFTEQGNLSERWKEKRLKTRRARLKVSILHLGADEVVVVLIPIAIGTVIGQERRASPDEFLFVLQLIVERMI